MCVCVCVPACLPYHCLTLLTTPPLGRAGGGGRVWEGDNAFNNGNVFLIGRTQCSNIDIAFIYMYIYIYIYIVKNGS